MGLIVTFSQFHLKLNNLFLLVINSRVIFFLILKECRYIIIYIIFQNHRHPLFSKNYQSKTMTTDLFPNTKKKERTLTFIGWESYIYSNV